MCHAAHSNSWKLGISIINFDHSPPPVPSFEILFPPPDNTKGGGSRMGYPPAKIFGVYNPKKIGLFPVFYGLLFFSFFSFFLLTLDF